MPTYQFVVMTRAVPGRLDEFDRWYDEQHIPDCLRVPEVKGCRRFKLLHGLGALAEGSPRQEPAFDSLALYEIETDDPDGVARALGAMSGSEAMPLTDAYDRTTSLKFIAVAAEQDRADSSAAPRPSAGM